MTEPREALAAAVLDACQNTASMYSDGEPRDDREWSLDVADRLITAGVVPLEVLTEPRGARLFRLVRSEDVSGTSGVGSVAEGAEFSTGKVVLAWTTEFRSVAVYDSLAEMERIHGHDGRTIVEWAAGVHLGDEGLPEGPGLDALRQLSEAATPGRWYVDGPEFGGMWVCVGHGDAQKSGAVHPSATGQPYAVLAGMGEADADLIVAAVNYVRLALASQENPEVSR